jgi:hypothetical protein
VTTKVGVDDYIVANGVTASGLENLERVSLWPVLAPEALSGLAGGVVRRLQPYTEADPAGLLAHLLVAMGNLIGPGPHTIAGADHHPGRLNVMLVGATGSGRKGSAWGPVRKVVERVDGTWAANRIKGGLSSGEGLIYHVRDARDEPQPIRGKRERGQPIKYETVVVDHGEPDKRLHVIETEFAAQLRRMGSETNTLSAVIRQAWDTGDLATLTKASPLKATGAHVSIVGHITPEELAAELRSTEAANGFANRFLFHLVKRSQLLPEGASIPDALISDLAADLGTVATFARSVGELRRDAEASEAWAAIYERLSGDGPGGLAGAVIARGAPQVLRLSVLYALLERAAVIRLPHLMSALAVWDHAEASARRVFGDVLGLPLADRIMALLRAKGPMDTTDLHRALAGHVHAEALQAALDTLLGKGLIRRVTAQTGGRPKTVYGVA